MNLNLHKRSLLTLLDVTPEEIAFLLTLAAQLKKQKRLKREIPRLIGKHVALIFEKPSTRTRCAFEIAIRDQGGYGTYMDPSSSQLGHKESLKDTARVLSRLYDAIEYRGFHQKDLEDLAHYACVPVYNGLTDQFHPTQILADLLTMQEFSHQPLDRLCFCYLGDARFNMGNSLLIGAAQMGMDIRFSAPESFWPNQSLVAQMRELAQHTGAAISFEPDPIKAVKQADFLYTDVWLSMGEPMDLWEERIQQLLPYQVNQRLMRATEKLTTKFMHCLPACHNIETKIGQQMAEKYGLKELEVTDEVFESDASIVFAQAENRMHTIKALLVATLGAQE